MPAARTARKRAKNILRRCVTLKRGTPHWAEHKPHKGQRVEAGIIKKDLFSKISKSCEVSKSLEPQTTIPRKLRLKALSQTLSQNLKLKAKEQEKQQELEKKLKEQQVAILTLMFSKLSLKLPLKTLSLNESPASTRALLLPQNPRRLECV